MRGNGSAEAKVELVAVMVRFPAALARKLDVICTMLDLSRSELVVRALQSEIAALDAMPEAKLAFKALETFHSSVAARKATK